MQTLSCMIHQQPTYVHKLKLQCTQNSLCRVILSGSHRDHLFASMQLSNLRWLPVCKCIDFKLALITYKIVSTHQPSYLHSLPFSYEPTRALRSSSQQLLNVPTVTTDLGRRVYSCCAPGFGMKSQPP